MEKGIIKDFEAQLGMTLADPVINDIYDYTAYLTLMELAGKSLPIESEINDKLNEYAEKRDPIPTNILDNVGDNKPKEVRTITLGDLMEDFREHLTYQLKRDLRYYRQYTAIHEKSMETYSQLLWRFVRLTDGKIEFNISNFTSSYKMFDAEFWEARMPQINDGKEEDVIKEAIKYVMYTIRDAKYIKPKTEE